MQIKWIRVPSYSSVKTIVGILFNNFLNPLSSSNNDYTLKASILACDGEGGEEESSSEDEREETALAAIKLVISN